MNIRYRLPSGWYRRTYVCECGERHSKFYRDGSRSPSTKLCFRCGGTMKKVWPPIEDKVGSEIPV